MNLTWAVIGGGVHGTHIALRLLLEGGVPREELRILDPGPRLLARWRSQTAATGMEYLRSSSVQNLALEAGALNRYARLHAVRSDVPFAPPYNRPSLSLFNAHCDHLIEQVHLDELHLRERVTEASLEEDRVTLRTSTGREISAQRIVLALGASDQPLWPDWAPRGDARVQHLFEIQDRPWPGSECGEIAVVGGGVSAAQAAIRLTDAGHRVRLISRHELRVEQFDVPPGWLGPRYMTGFRRTRSPERRRAMIDRARLSGTMPPDVQRVLRRRIELGRIDWLETEIRGVHCDGGALRLELAQGEDVTPGHIILATGFESERPGGQMISSLIDSGSLPCASCGYPVVDTYLRWHERIHVSGPLAELELGPVARNIAGARRAAERILLSLEAGQPRCSPRQ